MSDAQIGVTHIYDINIIAWHTMEVRARTVQTRVRQFVDRMRFDMTMVHIKGGGSSAHIVLRCEKDMRFALVLPGTI